MNDEKLMNLLECRDDLSTLKDLIHTCTVALQNKDVTEYEAGKIGCSLYFLGLPLIEKIDFILDNSH